jgi:hypothetical protein
MVFQNNSIRHRYLALESLPNLLLVVATFYWVFFTPQAPSTSIRDTYIWLWPGAFATVFPIAYLIIHGAVVHESGYNLSLLRATMVEQTVQNLVRSISCATSLSLVASQAFFALIYNIGTSLKPFRDWRGDIDGEAIFFFVGFLGLLGFVLLILGWVMVRIWLTSYLDLVRYLKIRKETQQYNKDKGLSKSSHQKCCGIMERIFSSLR